MKLDIINFLDNQKIDVIDLDASIFGLKEERVDLIQRYVLWQLAKRRSGTRCTKNVGEVSGSTKKPFKQKGTGRARQGNNRSALQVGGGVAHGPRNRSHAHAMNKKERVLAMRYVLSSFVNNDKLLVMDNIAMEKPKTSDLLAIINKISDKKILFIAGDNLDNNFFLSSLSLKNVDVLPVSGLNAYDCLKSDLIIIEKTAIDLLEKRFK